MYKLFNMKIAFKKVPFKLLALVRIQMVAIFRDALK